MDEYGWFKGGTDRWQTRWIDRKVDVQGKRERKKHTQENPMQPMAPHSISANIAGNEWAVGKYA